MSSHRKIHLRQRTPPVIAYRVILDVPRELVRYVSRLLAAERRAIGTRVRGHGLSRQLRVSVLNPGR